MTQTSDLYWPTWLPILQAAPRQKRVVIHGAPEQHTLLKELLESEFGALAFYFKPAFQDNIFFRKNKEIKGRLSIQIKKFGHLLWAQLSISIWVLDTWPWSKKHRPQTWQSRSFCTDFVASRRWDRQLKVLLKWVALWQQLPSSCT